MLKVPSTILNESYIQKYCEYHKITQKNMKPAHISYLISLIMSSWKNYEKMVNGKSLNEKLLRTDPDDKFLLFDILTDMLKLNGVILTGPKTLKRKVLELLYIREQHLNNIDIPAKQFTEVVSNWVYAALFFISMLTAEVRKKHNCKDGLKEFKPEKYGNDPDLIQAYLLLKSVNVVEAMANNAAKNIKERETLKKQKMKSKSIEK